MKEIHLGELGLDVYVGVSEIDRHRLVIKKPSGQADIPIDEIDYLPSEEKEGKWSQLIAGKETEFLSICSLWHEGAYDAAEAVEEIKALCPQVSAEEAEDMMRTAVLAAIMRGDVMG